MKQQCLFIRYSTLGEMFGPFLVEENHFIKTVLIKDELKKLEGQSLLSDIHTLVQEVFFAEKHKTHEDISNQCLQVKYSGLSHIDFIDIEKLKTESCSFWAVINGNQLYKFNEDEIKNIEYILPKFY